jgi:hypothetical protein
MRVRRAPLSLALMLSLMVHALLLSLGFGGQGWGLPGFSFPWQQRRAEAPELRVVLMPTRARGAVPAAVPITEPRPQETIEQPGGDGSTPDPSSLLAPDLARTAEAISPKTQQVTRAGDPAAELKSEPETLPKASAADDTAPAEAVLSSEASVDVAPVPIPQPLVVAVEPNTQTTWAVMPPSAASAPTPATAAASSPQAELSVPQDVIDAAQQQAAERVTADHLEREAQRQAALLETARLDTERKEAARREAEQVEAQRLDTERERQELARQHAARQEAQRVESARLEAERQQAVREDAARQESVRREMQMVENARLEAERQQAVRQEAARQEAQQIESARLEAQRAQAVRQEVARQEAGRQEAARAEAARDEERREASRRAMGRQLDEEAARRAAASEAANLASRLEPVSRGARRGRLFGRTDPNAELILYAEAWARKIELNMTVERIRDAAKRPHSAPLVTVAIRNDGSVESVTFLLSSGVAEIDDGIRRIVESLLPYPAFPPGLARDFDVIEIRRTWIIDTAVRLY